MNFVKHYKHFLLGRPFTYLCGPTTQRYNGCEPVGQQARLIGFLEEFEFDIVHRARIRHTNADALSTFPGGHVGRQVATV